MVRPGYDEDRNALSCTAMANRYELRLQVLTMNFSPFTRMRNPSGVASLFY